MNSRKDEYLKYLADHISAFKSCYPLAIEAILEVIPSAESTLKRYKTPPDHDTDKFRNDIFNNYLNYLYPDGDVKDGKWISVTPSVKEDFYEAWNEHQNHNPHHWQYWVCITDDYGYKAIEMPINYVAEMLADWATFMYIGKSKNMMNWYLTHKDKMILHPNTRKLVDQCLPLMEDKVRKYKENNNGSI